MILKKKVPASILLVGVFMLGIFKSGAQQKILSPKYDVVISFNSICCGAPSDDFLKDFVAKCIKVYNTGIEGWQTGACGREGEYKILLSAAKLNKAKKLKFMDSLKKIIEQRNGSNKNANASTGSITIDYNLSAESIQNCRGQIVPWNSSSKKKK